MERVFVIHSRFDPTRSLLGRWMRRIEADPRRAASLYIVTATVLALLLLLGQVVLRLSFVPERGIGGIEAGVAVLYVAGCLIGRKPDIFVHYDGEALAIDRPDSVLRVALASVNRYEMIDATTYYRHHRRFAATRDFVNRIHPHLLLIDVPQAPIILGLEPADLSELMAMLEHTTAGNSG